MKGLVKLAEASAIHSSGADWIQITASTRPAISPDRRLELYLSGEIYNGDLLAAKQAEVVLEAYMREGAALFKRLNGNFALLLVENQARRLTLICDRTASTTLIHTQLKDQFVFASTLRELLDLVGRDVKINPAALASFLACGFICEGKTLIEGAEILGPGQMLILQDGAVHVRNYWNYAFAQQRDERHPRILEEELYALLKQAIARRTQAGDRFGVLLSGGYDSRALLGCACQLYPQGEIHTITWGENEDGAHSDAGIAKAVAQKVGAKHTFFKLVAGALPEHFRSYVRLSEGRTDAVGNYPEALSVFEQCRKKLGLDYLLRGDECFGGARNVYTEADALHRLSIHSFDNLRNSFVYLQEPLRQSLCEANREQMQRMTENCPLTELHDRKDFFCYTQHIFGYLNPLTQLKQQVIPVRNPHLDNDVLDFVNLLPTSWRLGKALLRSTVEHKLSDVSLVRFAGSSNMTNWNGRLRTDPKLQAFVHRVLLQERNGFDDLINQQQLEGFLAQAMGPLKPWNRSLLQRAYKKIAQLDDRFILDASSEIFRLMILKIWAHEFLGGSFDLAT